MSTFMQNLNSNLLCAVDVETTGLDPRRHNIIQLAVLPLTDDIVPSRRHLPCIMEMVPGRPENIDQEAMRVNRMKLCDIMTRGLDAGLAADLFAEWFERLALPFNKRIVPLAHNWPFDRGFLIEWLGPKTFEMCFSADYRDTMATAIFCNDRAGWVGSDFPYPKVKLSYLCSQLKIERERDHDALDDARVTAEVYRRIVKEFI